MPTLNEYADNDGYYIRARPSDTGNITYQLKPRGEQIIEKVGYQDEAKIGWQVINALKVLNLVYTGNEGTTDNNISIDLDKEEKKVLSEKDAKQLLDELASVPRVNESQTDEIKEILGIEDDIRTDIEDYVTDIKSAIEKENVVENSRQNNISDSTTTVDLFTAHEDRDSEVQIDGTCVNFEITFAMDIIDESQQAGGGWGEIHTLFNRNRGIVEYSSNITLEPGNNDSMINYQRFLSEIVSAILSETTQSNQYTS